MHNDHLKGRGAKSNPANRFSSQSFSTLHQEGIDEEDINKRPQTQIFFEDNKKIVNKVNSPDLGFAYSANPYQGCEHGCIYCYARNTHEYWGFSAGIDFESKIIVKKNAAAVLENYLLGLNKNQVSPIVFSGNTDCYQPMEAEFKLTRACLEVCARLKHPVSIITKNSLILRDLDILKEMAKDRLVHVHISITGLNEKIRSVMEPRTASYKKRLRVIEELSDANIPVTAMIAPVIPSLNDHEIPRIIEAAALAGATGASYSIIRLNGQVGELFSQWIKEYFPDRADKVLRQIESLHGGNLNDSQFGRRMKGEGPISQMIKTLFNQSKKKYLKNKSVPPLNLTAFRKGGNYHLFDE